MGQQQPLTIAMVLELPEPSSPLPASSPASCASVEGGDGGPGGACTPPPAPAPVPMALCNSLTSLCSSWIAAPCSSDGAARQGGCGRPGWGNVHPAGCAIQVGASTLEPAQLTSATPGFCMLGRTRPLSSPQPSHSPATIQPCQPPGALTSDGWEGRPGWPGRPGQRLRSGCRC